MVIISTRAIEVSIQAVSPELIGEAAAAGAAGAAVVVSTTADEAVLTAELTADEAS